MREALETFQDFDPYGMGASFSWTPTDRQGLHGSVWYQWTEDGKYKRVTDWIEFDPIPMEQRNQAFWLSD